MRWELSGMAAVLVAGGTRQSELLVRKRACQTGAHPPAFCKYDERPRFRSLSE
jgi:hypothetical protein